MRKPRVYLCVNGPFKGRALPRAVAEKEGYQLFNCSHATATSQYFPHRDDPTPKSVLIWFNWDDEGRLRI